LLETLPNACKFGFKKAIKTLIDIWVACLYKIFMFFIETGLTTEMLFADFHL